MIIWSQDGSFFIYLEQCQCIGIEEAKDEIDGTIYYDICADEKILGEVNTFDEAKAVLVKIAAAFKSALVDVDPW